MAAKKGGRGLVGPPHKTVAPVRVTPDGPGLREHVRLVVSEVVAAAPAAAATLYIEAGLVLWLGEVLRADVSRLVVRASYLYRNFQLLIGTLKAQHKY